PEKSIQTQFDIGSDIIICLDDFTPPDATKTYAKETVERTVNWARKSKKEYTKQIKKRKLTDKTRPHLYSVVQGGYYKDLRKECAQGLQELGFDGYGYGGYVVDDKGNLDLDLSEFISQELPKDKIKFALGIGRPIDIANLRKMGWDIFDCTLPTRDARHKRLYTLNKDPTVSKNLSDSSNYSYIYINREKHLHENKPISKYCDCLVCTKYSRAYLRHLFKINDLSAFRLASLHNLRIYNILIENLV
ncbi:tRNA-ribosyltransferase family protein, partial [Patescibacteria group bacterium]